VASSLLAFRPSRVAERLGPRSHACPIAAGELIAPALRAGLILPVVRAPIAAVARAALVAAGALDAAIGLVLPAGVPVEPWFGAVARAADELGAWVPVVLAGEVRAGEGKAAARAFDDAWRLVDAGATHLSVDVTALDPAGRADAAARIAAAAIERGLGWDVVVELADAKGGRAAALVRDLSRRGAPPDLLGVSCPAADGEGDARAQAAVLAAMSATAGGVPVARRGPASPALLRLLRGSPVVLCDDGGAAAAAALGRAAGPEGAPATDPRALERVTAALTARERDRVEALAYVEASVLVERLGAAGGAGALAAALGARRAAR
jgi:hypothetical protein